MSELREHTAALKAKGEKALVAFFTAGYPDEATFVELVRTADRAGCDVIEIGVPFSDPIADGPLIQRSSQVALESGITLARILAVTGQLSKDIAAPIVLMGYVNPILNMGVDEFATRARAAGVTGAIVPDVPLEESAPLRGAFDSAGITYIDLLAPTSGDDRIGRVVAEAAGFLYLVSVTGVTGVRSPRAGDLEGFVANVRGRTKLPLYVGFGISDADKARSITALADGVIIGSALIRIIDEHGERAVAAVEKFLRGVKTAITNTDGER